ncbi:hypothetical protein AHMF7605_12000 [Adhaeribacter arboris]|uniref:Uncharacterized protein n=1 Tax=Adhaeribacter arboris TaxID=2072846 RepID=A0A2T2YFD1_9BACT|nr:hypothetical protein [Adhaeribacter arboris]PSR54193.1 hypothetical protein AHMF7605_12000 [Adhaeribacter arboris]
MPTIKNPRRNKFAAPPNHQQRLKTKQVDLRRQDVKMLLFRRKKQQILTIVEKDLDAFFQSNYPDVTTWEEIPTWNFSYNLALIHGLLLECFKCKQIKL